MKPRFIWFAALLSIACGGGAPLAAGYYQSNSPTSDHVPFYVVKTVGGNANTYVVGNNNCAAFEFGRATSEGGSSVDSPATFSLQGVQSGSSIICGPVSGTATQGTSSAEIDVELKSGGVEVQSLILQSVTQSEFQAGFRALAGEITFSTSTFSAAQIAFCSDLFSETCAELLGT